MCHQNVRVLPVCTVPPLLLHFQMGLVCFRLKSTETSGGKEGKTEEEEVINEKLLDKVNRSGKVYMVPSRVDGEYMIRLCVHHRTTEEDLSKQNDSVIPVLEITGKVDLLPFSDLAYEVLCSKAEEVLKLGAEDGGGVSDKVCGNAYKLLISI